MSRSFLQVSCLLATVLVLQVQAKELEKEVLFDGSGLDPFVAEWKVEDPYNELRDSIWSIEDDVLHGEGRVYGWLRSKDKYGDFLLHAEYKLLADNSNTGISVRCDPYTPYGRMNPSRSGYEVQLVQGDENLNEHGPFSLYRYVAPTHYSPNPIGEWHTLEVRCEGPLIQLVHNGDRVLDFDQSSHPTLKDIPLSGYVGLQTHGGGPIEFRNVWIQRLSDELPPALEDPGKGFSINFKELLRLSDGWKFKADPSGQGDSEDWDEPGLDDSDWSNIELGEVVDGPGWYRTQFEVGPIPRKADVFLYFASAQQNARVFLNGREIGFHDASRDGLNQRFGFRANRRLKKGKNTVAVFVDGDPEGKVTLGTATLLIERDP